MVQTSTRDTINEACLKYRNWGKWGPDDELGTLNYITPDKVVRATRLPRSGKAFSLALALDFSGPQTGGLNRINPMHTMLACGTDYVAGRQNAPWQHGLGYSDDVLTLTTHGGTHWDALCHIFWEGRMYNDRDPGLVGAGGALKNGIEKLKDQFVTRGVLLDVARFKGVDCLEDGHPITAQDLDDAAGAAGITIERGDIVLLRTGQMGRCLREQRWGTYAGGDSAGLSFWTAEWLYEKEIAGIASDTWGVEVRPNQLPNSMQPLHPVTVANMGLLLGEIFFLEDLAAACARERVYEFLLIAPPLPITGGTASPLAPLAIL